MTKKKAKEVRVEVFKANGSELYYWRALGANGEIQAQSEGYTRKSDAAKGATRLFDRVCDAGIAITYPKD